MLYARSSDESITAQMNNLSFSVQTITYHMVLGSGVKNAKMGNRECHSRAMQEAGEMQHGYEKFMQKSNETTQIMNFYHGQNNNNDFLCANILKDQPQQFHNRETMCELSMDG